MYLDSRNRSIKVVLTAAKTTTDMNILASYDDEEGPHDNLTVSYGSKAGTTSGVTAATVADAPSGTAIRLVRSITIYNADTASKVAQVSLVDGATTYPLVSVTLAVGDTLGYADKAGWYVMDASGNEKTTSTISGLLSTSASTGIGYATGAGSTVTQITSRSTGVTINAVCGKIHTDTTSLAAGASAVFTVTNSAVAIGDVVVVSQRSGSSLVAGVAGTAIVVIVSVAAGSFIIAINNNSTSTAETGAIIINFAVIKAVTA